MMKTKTKILIILTIILALHSPLIAQNIGNETKLELLSRGELSFFDVQSINETSKILLWNRDRNSSHWMFIVNGVHYKIESTAWKQETAQRRFAEVGDFTIVQELHLFTDEPYGLIKLSITNNSNKTVKIKPALLLDTYLGESTSIPFLLSNGDRISSETEIKPPSIPNWIKMTQGARSATLTLVFDNAMGANEPERIIMANYSLIKELGQRFVTVPRRTFTTLGTTYNNSAMLLEYEEKRTLRGKSYIVYLQFGIDQHIPNEVFLINELAELPEVDISYNASVRQGRLDKINELILTIDALLEDEPGITEEAVEKIKARVREQEKLWAEHENSQ